MRLLHDRLVHEAQVECDRLAQFECTVRLPLNVSSLSGGKPRRDHDELSRLICDRPIVEFAVAQQFHNRGGRSPAGENRVTRFVNACNVEDGHELIAAVRRAGDRGGTANAAATACVSACVAARANEPLFRPPDANGKTAGAAVAALVSTGGSRRTSGMPKTTAAPHAAIGARDDTTTRPIHMAVMIRELRQIVGSHHCVDNPLPILLRHQVRLKGYPQSSMHISPPRGHFRLKAYQGRRVPLRRNYLLRSAQPATDRLAP
jgi:hypothetical protein